MDVTACYDGDHNGSITVNDAVVGHTYRFQIGSASADRVATSTTVCFASVHVDWPFAGEPFNAGVQDLTTGAIWIGMCREGTPGNITPALPHVTSVSFDGTTVTASVTPAAGAPMRLTVDGSGDDTAHADSSGTSPQTLSVSTSTFDETTDATIIFSGNLGLTGFQFAWGWVTLGSGVVHTVTGGTFLISGCNCAGGGGGGGGGGAPPPDGDGTGPGGDDPTVPYGDGFRWIASQVQNDAVLRAPAVSPAWKDAGFFVGVWGVTYNAANFTRDGAALASQANLYDADFLIMDAEECLKNADPAPLIAALAAFAGPKALTTLGAAGAPFVFPIDYQAFLDAGYAILPQAYYSATSTADGQSAAYKPILCMEHADRAGVPRSSVHLMIDTCSSGHPTATEWRALLDEAGVGYDFSVFLSECTSLAAVPILLPDPVPEPSSMDFALPGLITDSSGGMPPGPGGPGAPGLPPPDDPGGGGGGGGGSPGPGGGIPPGGGGGGVPVPGDPGYYDPAGESPFIDPEDFHGPGSGDGWLGGFYRPGGIPPTTIQFWRSVVCDLDSTIETLLDHLATDRNVTYTLNDAAVASGKVPSASPEINIPALDTDPFLSYGVRLLYLFRREGGDPPWVCRFGGLLMQVEDEAEADNAFSHYTAYDPWKYLFSRPIVTADLVFPGKTGLTYTAKRGDEIVLDLLTNSIAAHGSVYLDIDSGVWETTTVIPTITFFRGQSIGEALQDLCRMTPQDIILDPVYDPLGRPGICSVVNVYNEAGVQKNEAIFAWDKPSRSLVGISRLHDGTQLANKIRMYDSNADPITPSAIDAASVTKYGEYWAEIFDTGQPTDPPLAIAGETELALRKTGKQTLSVHPAPSRMPRLFQEFFLGDKVPIYASNRMREPILEHKRVYSIPVDISDEGSETISELVVAPVDEA